MSDTNKLPEEDWGLNTLELKVGKFGTEKGKVTGKISFINGAAESFYLNLTSEVSNKFLDLIREEVIETTNLLGERIANSLTKVSSEDKK